MYVSPVFTMEWGIFGRTKKTSSAFAGYSIQFTVITPLPERMVKDSSSL
jgi:hypothetical protein